MIIKNHASTRSLEDVFSKYASVILNGERYMTPKDFVVHFLRIAEEQNVSEDFLNCITRAADSKRDGLISLDEFLAFEALLSTSDALYTLAFEMFDPDGCGYIHFDHFKQVLQLTQSHKYIPLDFDCDFIRLHFGANRSRHVTYEDFTQIVHDLNDEHVIQAFRRFDKAHTGTISVSDFSKVVSLLKGHLLTPFVREHLSTVALQGENHGRISFAYYVGFMNLLSNMELIKHIFHNLARGDHTAEFTKEEFLMESQLFSQITPMEVNILFRLISHLHPDGRLCCEDLASIAPVRDHPELRNSHLSAPQDAILQKMDPVRTRTTFLSCLEQAYRFTLGAIAGAVGAMAVYPIDLVKTRMQNQRTRSAIGELMYRNSWDCFRKVIRFEGFIGLYRGLVPQLVGVAPEKAIKLTMNDFVRDQFTYPTGSIPLLAEVVAGGCAGASQVVFTNPLEIVKIRLQVAGEIAGTKRISATTVLKDLGFFGLYKGASACFLRDIPFSAIYFTAYNHLKRVFADERGLNSPTSLLAAATLSGAPAACLTTPADVIKTRLQVVARRGQTVYSGILDAARKIWHEEGGRAFWKGAGARVCRSSPQFGVTLFTYEMLHRFFYIDFGGREPTGMSVDRCVPVTAPVNPNHIGGFRFATATFTELETRLGLCFPKYKLS